jgi:outer membrane protein
MEKRSNKVFTILTLLFLLSCSAWLPVRAAEGEAISLAEALQMALANPYNLGASSATVTVAEAQKQKAEAGRWPSLGLSSNYTRIGPHTSVDMKNMKLVPDPSTGGFKVDLPPTKAGATDTYSTSLNLQLPVYMGGKLASAAEMARLGLHTAEIDYQAEYQNLIYQVIQAYIGVLKADGMVELGKGQVELLKEHQRLIETNLGLGYATKNDLMETQIRVTQAELGTVKAEHGKKLALENLCNLLGIPPQEVVLSSRPVLRERTHLPGLEEVLRRAEEGRPELKKLEAAVRLAEESFQLSKKYWHPNLVMIGSYGTQNQNRPTFEDAVWSFTLNLDWKFFDAGTGKAGIRENEANLETLRFRLAQARDLLKLEVRQKYLAVTEAARVLALTELSREQAAENYAFLKAKFELGAATNLELLAAQNTLNMAENEYLNAEYDYYLAVSDLYKTMGETEKFMLEVGEDA